jgi:uncharacterized protein (DUF1330 family)
MARLFRCEEVAPVAAFIVEEQLEVHDPAQLAAYHDQVPAALAAHGGRYRVVPHDPVAVLEGAWHPAGIGVIEFPDLDRARAWWGSSASAPLRQLRQAGARFNTVLVPGFDDDPSQRAEPACFVLTERLAGSWHRNEPDLNAYVDAITPIFERYDARYRAFRTRPLEVLEGSWSGHDQGLTLSEFPDRAHAQAWYDDPDYVPWRELRKAHNTNQIVLCGR